MYGRSRSLPARRVEGIDLGTLVHDFGKLPIPRDILTRPGRLGPEEFALVTRMSVAGTLPIMRIVLRCSERRAIDPKIDRVCDHLCSAGSNI